MKNLFLYLLKKVSNTSIGIFILNSCPTNININILDKPKSFFVKYLGLALLKIARYNKSSLPIIKDVVFLSNPSFKMKLDINEFTQCGYYASFYDLYLLRLINLGGEGFIDIGSNVGFYSLAASHHFKKVYSFEPFPCTYKKLLINIKINNLKNIKAFNIALSNKKSESNLYINPLNNGGASLNSFSNKLKNENHDYQWNKIIVPTETLDKIINLNSDLKVDLIKLDVEGHEASVFKGARKIILKYRPLIYVEVMKNKEKLLKLQDLIPKNYITFSLKFKKIILSVDSVEDDDLLLCPFEKFEHFLEEFYR